MQKNLTKNLRWLISVSLLFLILMTVARIILFFVFRNSGQSFLASTSAFVLGIRYDLREVGILAVCMLLLGAIKPLNPFKSTLGKKFWFTLLSVFSFLLVLFYAIDFAHYDYLHQRLNASALNFLQDASTSFSMVMQTYPVVRILLLIIAISCAIIYFIFRSYKAIAAQADGENIAKRRWIWNVVAFILFGVGIYGHLGQYPLRWSDAFSLGDDHLSQLALNPVQSFFSSFSFRHDSYDRKKVEGAYPFMASYLGVIRPDSITLNFDRTIPGSETSTPPNVILVICESFSGYKSSMWGNPLNTTPYFNQLCNEGVFFDHCFTPHFGTARGVWATITNIPDVQLDKTASRNPAVADQHTIINDLSEYEKYYFIGGSTSWANMRALLDNNIKGLNLYEQDRYDAPRVDVWGISDKNLFLQANKVLSKQQKPFFAVIQTSDNHRPYTIPNEDKDEFKVLHYSLDSLHKFGFQSNDELNAFRYTDFCFQKFIETAKKESYFKNTVFVFVGDHGIRGDAANMFPRAWTDNGLTCFHVPLLFYAPGILTPARHTMNCSQVDILPTIAGITKEPYHNTALGRDLLHLSDTTSNISFVIDHDVRQIGVVKGDYYFTRQLETNKEVFMSIRDNKPLAESSVTDSIRNALKRYTEDFYETSRYLLFNNKKKETALSSK